MGVSHPGPLFPPISELGTLQDASTAIHLISWVLAGGGGGCTRCGSVLTCTYISHTMGVA